MVSFAVYPSWHLMRQAALDPDKGAGRNTREMVRATRGPRKTRVNCAIGQTPAKWLKRPRDFMRGVPKNPYNEKAVFCGFPTHF